MAWLTKRGSFYYIKFSLAGKKKRIATGTESLQIAKEELRQFESAQARGEDSPLPSKTPITNVLTAYVTHIRATKTAKSAQTDIYYLRDAFGPICDAVKVTSRIVSKKAKKRPPKPGQDRRRKAQVIEAPCFEQISTAQVATFISGQVASRGLAPKPPEHQRRPQPQHRLVMRPNPIAMLLPTVPREAPFDTNVHSAKNPRPRTVSITTTAHFNWRLMKIAECDPPV